MSDTFNVENGIGIYDANGDPLLNILAGTQSPVQPDASQKLDTAPVGSLYVQTGTNLIYQKGSPAPSSWVLNSNGPVEKGLLLKNVLCVPETYLGAAVKMNSQGIAELALADTYENANVIGLIEEKQAVDICDIRFFGLTSEIFFGLNTTEEYFLSADVPGKIVTIAEAPRLLNQIRLKVGQPFSDKRFVFFKGERIVKG